MDAKKHICALLVALSALTTVGAIAAPPPTSPPPESSGKVKLSLLEVWASHKAQPAKFPAALKRFQKLLEAKSGKETFNSFRLEKPKTPVELTPGKAKTFKLPEGYVLKLTPQRGGKGKKGWELKYHLANRDRSWSSKLTLQVRGGKKPYVIRSPIGNKSERLVLIIECAPPRRSSL